MGQTVCGIQSERDSRMGLGAGYFSVLPTAHQRAGYMARFCFAWAREIAGWSLPDALLALAGADAVPAEVVNAGGPEPLTTGDMACLLDGIENRSATDWQRMLGDCPKWLTSARVTRGAPGRAPASWNPVTVAIALQGRRVPVAKLRPIFANQLAAHWADEWARANQAANDYGI